jgi:hypothetical protein
MAYLYIDTGRTSKQKKPDNVVVGKRFAQLYSGVFRLFAQMSTPCSKNLFIWAIENADRWNMITLNKAGRASFIADHMTATGEKYADETVKKAVKVVMESGIMVSMSDDGKRGASYMVNPYYVWKTKSKTDRYEAIKAYINILKENEGNKIQ